VKICPFSSKKYLAVIFLGSANAAKGLDYPHHHPCFDFDESVLSMGVELFVRCVEKFLG
jgi:amidohydrolase